jgi:WD40 repeat protein
MLARSRYLRRILSTTYGRFWNAVVSDVTGPRSNLSPDGSLLAIATDGQVQAWRVATGTKVARWEVTGVSVERLTFTPDSKRLIANCFGEDQYHHSARIYRLGADQVEADLPLAGWFERALHYAGPHSIRLSNDGPNYGRRRRAYLPGFHRRWARLVGFRFVEQCTATFAPLLGT